MKEHKLKGWRGWACTLCLSFPALAAYASFDLISGGRPAPLYYSGGNEVVRTALSLYAADARQVSGNAPELLQAARPMCIMVGTLGQDAAFDRFVNGSGLRLDHLRGKWEAYHLEEAEVDGRRYWVVAGSDARGTAYGVLELSRLIGVSPWAWWADVRPERRNEVRLTDGLVIEESPDVQFRGIFLNDEDWGLNPWSSAHFEPSAQPGRIGPRTYEKIFELLLRLRANTIWPAMHECTVPFFQVEGNRAMADKYGIVLGTSHCEPMMRNSAGEWDRRTMGAYNYKTNAGSIRQYWSQRLDQVKETECIFTVGLRGVHDGRMEGVKGVDEETAMLERVIADQRAMLAGAFGRSADRIPQIFVPYKEVLRAYDNGLRLPDDVSLVWCDDNHGYITRLGSPDEQRRSGGAGVYYHVSYWGKPHDYLWLASTQPALVYKEMKRAWDCQARRLWVLNVGDIKPGEYLTDFFLTLAWDIDCVKPEMLYAHQREWYSSIFGEAAGGEIDRIMREYYRLAAERKPEHMGWSYVESTRPGAVRGLTPVADTEFNSFGQTDEPRARIAEYAALAGRVDRLRARIPAGRAEAFFELVEYPVAAAAAMNEKLLYAQQARTYARYGLPVALEYAERSQAAYNRIAGLTHRYNRELLHGKWNGMMDFCPRGLPVFQAPAFGEMAVRSSDSLKVQLPGVPVLRNAAGPLALRVPAGADSVLVSFFGASGRRMAWEVEHCPAGVSVREVPNGFLHRIDLSISAAPAAGGSSVPSGALRLCVGGRQVCLSVNGDTVARNRSQSVAAADFTASRGRVTVFEGLGHSGRAVAVEPAGKVKKTSPFLEYEVHVAVPGEARLLVGTIPVHPARSGGEVRMAVSVDGGRPEVVSLQAGFLSERWTENVLRNQVLTEVPYRFTTAGRHTLRLYAIDADICFDQLKVDFDADGCRPYLLRH